MKPKPTYEELEQIAQELEARVVWALKFMKAPGSGMVVKNMNTTMEMEHWTIWFANAAELLGRYKIDRELMGLPIREQNKILKRRGLAPSHPNPA